MNRREFLTNSAKVASLAMLPQGILWHADIRGKESVEQAGPASGPLRVHAKNPRYFSDARGRAVLLTGSHTWNNLLDMSQGDPPEKLDFAAYLDFLTYYGHNFIRLWTWDSVTWDTRANKLGRDFVYHVGPHPWARVGSEKALDGKPKFDLSQFDPVYFDRLRSRVSEAGRRGVYVSVMLFEGWGLRYGNRGRAAPTGWAWRGHPFNPDNNVNGIDAGVAEEPDNGKPHSLGNRAVNAIQAAYIRQVVDTVNDLDNVLFEVINEGGEKEWDWWVADTLREHERSKAKQHPIGITGHGAEDLNSMLASPADWISPGALDGFRDAPPAWNGQKVSLLDTDHIWGIGGNQAWVWKSFLRGHNPIFMDPYNGSVLGKPFDSQWDPIRRSMGLARRLAERISLATMTPQNGLASTKYCLAEPGSAYLVYLPSGGSATLDLRNAPGEYAVEWLECSSGKSRLGKNVAGETPREFSSPFSADAVLYLRQFAQV